MVPIPRIQHLSHTWIKPTEPTPSHKKRTELSDWDNVMFASYIPMLLFYENKIGDLDFMHSDFLKDSLSKTLNDFYPLAGRLVDMGNGRDAIENNDEGVLFVDAEYSQDLSIFKKTGYLPSQMDYHRLFPMHFYCSQQDPLVAIQVTRFTDGGVALGIMILQKVADLYAVSHFIDAWSKVSRDDKFSPATFDRTLVRFPKDSAITNEVIEHYREERRVHKPQSIQRFSQQINPRGPVPLKSIILEFNTEGVQQCKRDAHTAEMVSSKNWVSTKDSLLAMVLRAVMISRNLSQNAAMKATTSVNGRSKMKNHKEMDFYFGNWTISRTFKTSLEEIGQTPLAHTAISFRQLSTNLQPSLFHGISKLYTLHGDFSVNYLTYQPNSETQTTANDISVLPFYKADFGFGQPDRTRTYVSLGGNGCFTVFGRGNNIDGIVYDIQLQMDVDSIARFIENPDIKKYTKNILY